MLKRNCVFSLISGCSPQGVLTNLHIQLWSSPKSSPYGVLVWLWMCQHSLLKCGYIKKRYQLHVKALLSLKQIMADHTFYFGPVLNVPCFQSLSLITLLSFPICIPHPLCVQTRWFFILISQIQISSEEIKAQLVWRWMVWKSCRKTWALLSLISTHAQNSIQI